MSLALAAERTTRIGLGPGVLMPNLRHPMTNAAATATLAGLAPGRVAVSFGTGFTGRRAMGYRAIPWSFMTAYIDAYCGLLRGEIVEWEGARMQMLHPDGSAPGPPDRRADPHRRPRAEGSRGRRGPRRRVRDDHARRARARRLRLGRLPLLGHGARRRARTLVVGAGAGRRRARVAPSPTTAPTSSTAVTPCPSLPGGKEWLAVIDERPRGRAPPRRPRRPLHPPQRGRPGRVGGDRRGAAAVDDGHRHRRRGPARIDELGAQGVTEVVFQPCGPDIRRELEAMFAAAGG